MRTRTRRSLESWVPEAKLRFEGTDQQDPATRIVILLTMDPSQSPRPDDNAGQHNLTGLVSQLQHVSHLIPQDNRKIASYNGSGLANLIESLLFDPKLAWRSGPRHAQLMRPDPRPLPTYKNVNYWGPKPTSWSKPESIWLLPHLITLPPQSIH